MSDDGRTDEDAFTELIATRLHAVEDTQEKIRGMEVQAYQALLKARMEIGHRVVKDASNPHFKSRFASLEAVMAAVEPVLHENGLILLQTVDGQVLRSKIVHADTGYEIECGDYPLICVKQNDPQALGSSMTYARRYTTMAIMGLAPADDDGERAAGSGGSAKEPPAMPKAREPEDDPDSDYISEAQRKRLFAIAKKNGWKTADMKEELDKIWHLSSTTKIPKAGTTYEDICQFFEAPPLPELEDDLD